MTLIWKLLRKHISIFELAVFFVANLIGLVVILSGVQIYTDAKPFLDGGVESIVGNDYVAISKKIERSGLKSAESLFTSEQIDEISNHECINSVGSFTAANFEVRARLDVGMGSAPMSTVMFFEAVPNEFIDVDLEEWAVDTSLVLSNREAIERGTAQHRLKEVRIPIVIPRNYLNLYNFGLSQSQGLPQINDDLIKRLGIEINVMGDKQYVDSQGVLRRRADKYTGYIVGFSDRINTVLVPLEFVEWANGYYNEPVKVGDNTVDNAPSRLILEVTNPSDPKFIEFLEQHNYIAEGEASNSGKALMILERGVIVVVAIGALFCLLSIIILTLSIYLLLQKNIDKLENLVLIGYTPMKVSMPYILMTVVLNVSIMVVSFILISVGRTHFLAPMISDIMGVGLCTTMTPTIVVGLLLTTAIILFNIYIIYRKVSQISKKR